MRKNIQKFTNQVRESDEETKWSWSLLFAVIGTAIVLGLWGGYSYIFNEESGDIAVQTSEEIEIQKEASAQVANVGTTVRNLLDNVREATGARRNVHIDSEDRNFIYDDLEPIPPTPLP